MSATLRALARAWPQRQVVVEEHRAFTRAGLEDQIDRLCYVLADAGATAGARIAWSMRNRAEALMVAFAGQRLGAVVVPISYRSTAPEVARMLTLADPVAVLTEHATRPVFADAGPVPVLDVDDPGFAEALAAAPAAPFTAAQGVERLGAGASMIFTSGTTGSPKAALRTKSEQRLSKIIADGLGFTAATRYIASGPLYHSGPWACALMTLNRGGAVGLQPRFDPASWLAFASRHDMTGTFITPTQLRQLVGQVDRGLEPPATLVNVVVSGEPFPAELKRRSLAAFGRCIIDCYGSTELGPVCMAGPDELLERPDSCGRPFEGVQIAAFQGERRLGPGAAGLLRMRTPLSFDGYVNPATGLPERPPGSWGTVGDIGYTDEDGYVYLIDRSADRIVTGGVNVFPADVEAVLTEHPDVGQCAVFGVPDARWGEVVCAAVVAERELDLGEVRDWLRGRLADDKRPRRLVRLPSLPTTATGKLSRRAARQLLLARDAGSPADSQG